MRVRKPEEAVELGGTLSFLHYHCMLENIGAMIPVQDLHNTEIINIGHRLESVVSVHPSLIIYRQKEFLED